METRQEYKEGIYESNRKELIRDKDFKCLLDYALSFDLISKEYLVELVHESSIPYEEIETWQ